MEKNICNTLKTAIQQRLNSGESINSIAKRAGVSHAQVCRFLSGERSISIDCAARIATVLGLELRPIKQGRKSRQTAVE